MVENEAKKKTTRHKQTHAVQRKEANNEFYQYLSAQCRQEKQLNDKNGQLLLYIKVN